MTCLLPCHPGPHTICKEKMDLECYCGKVRLDTLCCFSKKSSQFSCGNICKKSLNCGNHYCKLDCHEGDCPGNHQNERCIDCFMESKDKFKTIIKGLEGIARSIHVPFNGLADIFTNFIFEGILPCQKHFNQEINVDDQLKNIMRIFKISGTNILINLRRLIPICKEKDENECACKSTTNPGLCYQINYPYELLKFIMINKRLYH